MLRRRIVRRRPKRCGASIWPLWLTARRWASTTPVPSQYRLSGQVHAIGLTWDDGSPVATAITPPSDPLSFSVRAPRCQFADRTLAGFRIHAGRDDDLPMHRDAIWLSRVGRAPRAPPRSRHNGVAARLFI